MATIPYNTNATVDTGPGGAALQPNPTGPTSPPNSPVVPTPVVNSNPATNQANQAQQVVNNPPSALTAEQTRYDFLDSAGRAVNFVGSGANANAYASAHGWRPVGSNTPPVNTPPQTPPQPLNTPEHQIMNPGQTQYYSNADGSVVSLPTTPDGQPPAGYSTVPPQNRPTTDSFSSSDGSNYMQFNDGTYGKFNPTTGTFQTINQGAFSAQKQIFNDTKRLNDLKNGIYSTEQQQQIDAITAQYTDLINRQTTANANATGGQTIAQNMYGMGNSISGQGEITQVINDGIRKITAIQADMTMALSKMKQGFLSDDMDAVKAGWDVYNSSQATVQKELDRLQEKTLAAQTRMDNFMITNATNLNNKYSDLNGDNIITPNDTQQQINDKLKTSTIWQNAQLKNNANTTSAIAKADSQTLNLSQSEIETMAEQVEQMGVSVLSGYGRGDSPNRRAIMEQVAKDISSGKSNPLGLNAIELKFASNVGTQNVLKYLGSLTGQNGQPGNLDELISASNSIDRTQFKPFNQALYYALENSGDPNISRFATAAVEVADQVAKVLQGGTGSATSDLKLKQGIDLFNAAKTKEQMIATVTEMKKLLQNRKDSLIGNNQFLQEYSSHPTVQGGSSLGGGTNTSGGGATFGWNGE